MAFQMPVKTVVARPAPMTLAEVLARIAGDTGLPQSRRRNLCSSLRSFARILGKDLAALPAHLGRYRESLQRVHPAQAKISLKRWRNIKSDVLFVFRHLGLQQLPGRSQTPLTPEWRTLNARLSDAGSRYQLSRFFRFCSARGIRPENVSDTVAEAYLRTLTEESFAKSPKRIHRRTCVLWNRAEAEVPGWPQITLTVPDHRKHRTVPWDAFPHSFRAEVEAWLAAASGKDLLGDSGPTPPLSPRTVKTRRYQVQVFASALTQQGRDPSTITSLAALVELETFKAGLRFLYERYGHRKSPWIHNIAVALKSMARHWLNVDRDHLEQLTAICPRLNPGKSGLTEKNRERLRQFDDPRNRSLLLHFPQSQLREVLRYDRGHRRDALKVQIALAVEMLMMAPVRIGNLAAINIDRHLQWSRAGLQGLVHLVIPGEEVKNGEPLEFELPADTVALLDTYLKRYHPRLVDGPNPWLFPGRNGKPKSTALLGHQIAEMVFQATGLRVHVHLFRHIAAKLYLDANPGGYEVVRRVLGHRSIETTAQFYSGFETAAAARHYDHEILKLRHDLAPAPGGKD